MNYLFDINHPAQVHLFKHSITALKQAGHSVFVTVKNIKSAQDLLIRYGIEYIPIGDKSDALGGKIINQIKYDYRMYKLIKKLGVDLGVGTSITLSHVSKVSGITAFITDDDDAAVQPLFAKFAHPFADYLLSPDCLQNDDYGDKHFKYPGYHELAYLHPDIFTPEKDVLADLGVTEGDPYFILRFNAFKAHHDVNVKGLSTEDKHTLVNHLLKKGKVFITSEKDIDPDFKQYQIAISPEKIHSAIYYSTMLIGDSQTMTSEAAVLGVPAIRSNSLVGKISYLAEQEHRYGLTYGFLPHQTNEMIAKIKELLELADLREQWMKKREVMLKDKINVTKFFLWLLTNYPESPKLFLQKQSEFFNQFK